MNSKVIKSIFLSIPLILSSLYFGKICAKALWVHQDLIVSPSYDGVVFILQFFISVCLMALSAGIVVMLVRPIWFGSLVFTLSAFCICLTWGGGFGIFIFALIYIVAAGFYYVNGMREIEQRVNFSVKAVQKTHGFFLLILGVIVLASFYAGYSKTITEEGFSVPEEYLEVIIENSRKPMLNIVPESYKPMFEMSFDMVRYSQVSQMIKAMLSPYEKYIPLMVAFSFFMIFSFVIRFLGWVPVFILKLFITLLTVSGFIEVVRETKEVTRLAL